MTVSFTCYLPNIRPTFQNLYISPDVSTEKSGESAFFVFEACSQGSEALLREPQVGDESAEPFHQIKQQNKAKRVYI